MKRKKLICLLLAAVLVLGLSAYAIADAPVTLHTGGGVIVHSDWRMTTDYTYSGTVTTLPTPQMAGATFDGWYESSSLTGTVHGAGSTVEGGEYYAKWTPENTADNGKMTFTLSPRGGNAKGYKNGQELKAFYCNMGYQMTYSLSAPASAGGSADYSGSELNEYSSYYKLGSSDTYLFRTMNLEGGLVRITYYVTNRGSSAVSGLSVGAAGDSQLGGNDEVPLSVVSGGGETYMRMYDSTANNELRIYYKGNNVTDTDRFWYGAYQAAENKNGKTYLGNAFNDGKDGSYKDGVDSAFACSWNNISLASGETKKFSVLLGVGTTGTLTGGCSLNYDPTGGTWGNGTPASRSYTNGDIVTVSQYEPTREGYNFEGWGLKLGAQGTLYKYGTENDKVAVLGETTLYAKWGPIPYDVSIAVKQDSTAYPGAKITLVQYHTEKYRLADMSGTYNGQAINGIYDIYLDGRDTGENLTVNNDDIELTIDFRSANVNLTKDDAAWSGQTVALYNDLGAKLYDLTYENSIYSANLVVPGIYNVYQNGADTGVDLDLSDTSVDEPFTLNLPFFTANINLTLDGAKWTAQKITVGGIGAQYSGGFYSAIVPAGEQSIMRGTDEIGTVSSKAQCDLAFFTVTFYDDIRKIEIQYIKDGETVTADNPRKSGCSFFGWQNSGGTAITLPLEITAKTDIFAVWSNPVVIPGAFSKTDTTHYKYPNLKITGYTSGERVSSMTITVSSGSVTLADGSGYTVARSTDNKTVTVVYDSAATVSDAQTLLKTAVFTLSGAAQTVTYRVFAEQPID